jgi:hypothetical protein
MIELKPQYCWHKTNFSSSNLIWLNIIIKHAPFSAKLWIPTWRPAYHLPPNVTIRFPVTYSVHMSAWLHLYWGRFCQNLFSKWSIVLWTWTGQSSFAFVYLLDSRLSLHIHLIMLPHWFPVCALTSCSKCPFFLAVNNGRNWSRACTQPMSSHS